MITMTNVFPIVIAPVLRVAADDLLACEHDPGNGRGLLALHGAPPSWYSIGPTRP